MDKKIIIIIVSYNGMKWLPQTLESTGLYSVILVDNASSDDSVVYVRSKHPNITILQQEKNIGFGKANNIGISRALQNGAEYVFLLNQDARLHSTDTLDILLKHAERNKDFGIISPLHLNGKGDNLETVFSNYLNKKKELISDLLLQKPKRDLYEYNMINAAAWLIPKHTLLKVGGFHPTFFLYGEDDNYCQRVLYHGLKIGVCPQAFVYHDSGKEYHQNPKVGSQKYYEKFLNQVKVVYADVNRDNQKDLQFYKKSLLKYAIISLFKFKFSESEISFKKWKLIRELNFESIKMECKKEESPFLLN